MTVLKDGTTFLEQLMQEDVEKLPKVMALFADAQLYEQKKDGHKMKGLAANLREHVTRTEATSRAVRQMEAEGRSDEEAVSQIGAAQAALL